MTITRQEEKRATHYCTKAEAEALIKKSYVKGITYFVRCSTFLYTQQPAEGVDGRGYDDICTNLAVSQKDALKVAKGLLWDVFEAKGARLKIEVVDGTYGYRFVHIG